MNPDRLEWSAEPDHMRATRELSTIPDDVFSGNASSPEHTMFGFQGGEAADVVARKAGYMLDAQQRWKFLTNFDCSTIKNEFQLRSMVQTRSSISAEQAGRDVHDWMRDKQF
jgi:hypothetical protein